MAQIQEPPSSANTQYPFNSVMQTESGHFQEFDDTPGHERIRTQHKAGTFTEIHPDGTEVHKIVGNGYYITAKDGNILIQGQCNINVVGNAEIVVGGDAITHVKGSVKQVVEKDYNLLVKGEYTVTSGKNVNVNTPTGTTYVSSGKRMVLNTDLTVHGEVLADSLHSEGAVTAGTGIHAGLPGVVGNTAGISTIGGINVGVPGPTVPGAIVATNFITSGVSMFAPTVSDLVGSMEMLRIKIDTHVHIGNKGYPTSPPTSPMEV